MSLCLRLFIGFLFGVTFIHVLLEREGREEDALFTASKEERKKTVRCCQKSWTQVKVILLPLWKRLGLGGK